MDMPTQRGRNRSQASLDDDDDVSLARFGVRCETLTPAKSSGSSGSSKRDSSSKKFEPKSDRLKSVMSSYLK